MYVTRSEQLLVVSFATSKTICLLTTFMNHSEQPQYIGSKIRKYPHHNMIQFVVEIHPSIHFLQLILLGVALGDAAGAYSLAQDLRAKAGTPWTSHQFNTVQGWHIETNNHPHSYSHLRAILEWPINPQSACFWTVGRSWSTRREPRQTLGEHAI